MEIPDTVVVAIITAVATITAAWFGRQRAESTAKSDRQFAEDHVDLLLDHLRSGSLRVHRDCPTPTPTSDDDGAPDSPERSNSPCER